MGLGNIFGKKVKKQLSMIEVNGSPMFLWKGTYEERLLAKEANFKYDKDGVWFTKDPYQAYRLIDHGDASAVSYLIGIDENVEFSRELFSDDEIPCPDDQMYMDFQKRGVMNAMEKQVHLIADEMGVGKTIQAIGVANYNGHRKILVICPASLRLKWVREINKWHIWNRGSQAVITSKDSLAKGITTVISYDLAVVLKDWIKDQTWDLLVIDEAHALKNPDTKRTCAIMGEMKVNGWFEKGIKDSARQILLLTGTPIPNRAHEFFFLLKSIAPDVLAPKYLHYGSFIKQFCEFYYGDHGLVITGSKNEWELHNRLRGSGFMTRRLKKDVLPQLPDKMHNLIVFPADSATAQVLKKEEPFNPEEVLKSGATCHPALPEIRREMGEAKIPLIIDYVEMLLDETDKVLVGAIHRNVVAGLVEGLAKFNPAVITGSTAQQKRQDEVDRFQGDKSCRVFIGNLQAAGEGHDLTSSCEVVLAEPDWVPLKNDQFIDRAHRIGQNFKVNVHYLVVENSLDAYILGTALEKSTGINKILEGVS